MTSNPSSPSPGDTAKLLVTFDRNSVWNERYTIGVDLGQSHDPTAIAIVRRIDDDPARPVFQVGHLALQLRFSFEMSATRLSLVSASPERPGDALAARYRTSAASIFPKRNRLVGLVLKNWAGTGIGLRDGESVARATRR
jgi:hypothetical protein